MKYRSRWHEIDGGAIFALLAFIVIVLTTIFGSIILLKEEDYKHEIELKKVELCGEDGE